MWDKILIVVLVGGFVIAGLWVYITQVKDFYDDNFWNDFD